MLRFCPEQIERWPIARLLPYARNARTHSEDQVVKLAASLVEYGWTAPVLVSDAGEIIAVTAGCWPPANWGWTRCR